MNSTLPVFLLLYAGLVVGCGFAASVFNRNHSIQKFFVAGLIPIFSFCTLGYLLWSGIIIGSEQTVTMHRWELPFAEFTFGIDSLTILFLVPLLILAAATSLYGPCYAEKHDVGRGHWFYFSLLIGAMVVVLLARNAILFIIAWEVMALSSFLLVLTDAKKSECLHAGWIYFLTTHLGSAFLLVMFFLFASSTNSFEFTLWKGVQLTAQKADLIFILAVIAFGLKAGFIPFHVWLPLAHPAAPSYVSALMSGIMIKMGIYGIFRLLALIGFFHTWWGILFIIFGAVSGVMGVLFALGQHDLKRLLAYHSVENIGIILLGIGIGIIGSTNGLPVIALFGFAGALLHVVNHALFKSLLFLGAGAVLRQTGTASIDHLGGLIKKMPQTTLLFLVGALAICGLPFFNGFIGELYIYFASVNGIVNELGVIVPLVGLVTALSLAGMGGLAAACFTKVFGVVFLGAPRNPDFIGVTEAPRSMTFAMTIIAFVCVGIGLCSFLIVPLVAAPVLSLASGVKVEDIALIKHFTITINIVLALLLGAGITIGLIYFLFRRTKRITSTVTWDCGYCKPQASMQYTASSFASPIINYFRSVLAESNRLRGGSDLFPDKRWHFHTSVDDWMLSRIYAPCLGFINNILPSLHWLQSGKTGVYVLFIAVVVVFLIIWKFFL